VPGSMFEITFDLW